MSQPKESKSLMAEMAFLSCQRAHIALARHAYRTCNATMGILVLTMGLNVGLIFVAAGDTPMVIMSVLLLLLCGIAYMRLNATVRLLLLRFNKQQLNANAVKLEPLSPAK